MTENELEKDLRLVATGNGTAAEFYQTLLRSEIFVLGDLGNNAEHHVSTVLKAESPLNIQSWTKDDGTEVIPFFTSLAAVQKFLKSENTYVAISAANLFEITLGAHLVLNPKSDYSRDFSPHEVSLLIGRPDGSSVTKHVVEEKIPVSIGQPAQYPQDLVDALINVLPLHEDVSCAFLAQIVGRNGNPNPELIIGLQSRSEIGSILPELSNHMQGKTQDGQAVMIVRVEPGNEGVSEYMLRTTPFYERKGATPRVQEKPKRKPWFNFKK